MFRLGGVLTKQQPRMKRLILELSPNCTLTSFYHRRIGIMQEYEAEDNYSKSKEWVEEA